MPSRGFFGGLKAMDAFGKVCPACHDDWLVCPPMFIHRPDHGGCQSQNTHRGVLCVHFRLRESFRSAIVVDTSTFWPVVTLVSVAIILSFTMIEFLDYRRIGIDTSVVVDRSRGEKLTVHLNVTFPRVPCYRELFHANHPAAARRTLS